MADSTNPFLQVARVWDRLEPAMNPHGARTKHVKLAASKSYPAGQLVGPVTATPGLYDKPGAGVQGPYFLVQYPVTTDANSRASLGDTSLANDSKFETVPVYWKGSFFAKDLVGIADATILGNTGDLVQGLNKDDAAAIVALKAGG